VYPDLSERGSDRAVKYLMSCEALQDYVTNVLYG
jgi:hypothetical protein